MPRVKGKKEQQTSKELFVVRNIIDYQQTQEGEKYLVHWKGFPKESSTWESVENIKAFDD